MKRIKNIILFICILSVVSLGTLCSNTKAQEEIKNESIPIGPVEQIAINETSDIFYDTEDIVINTENVNNNPVNVSEEVEEIDIYELKAQEVLEKQKALESITDKKEWFVEYKKLINEYSEWVDPPESVYDVFNADEIYLMQRCIETETFEASFDAKVNVASVILNRLKDDNFKSNGSVHKIIVPGQFAYGRKNISEDTILALEYAYMIGDTTQGAVYFHSLSYRSKFSGADYIFTDDAGHHFYK